MGSLDFGFSGGSGFSKGLGPKGPGMFVSAVWVRGGFRVRGFEFWGLGFLTFHGGKMVLRSCVV